MNIRKEKVYIGLYKDSLEESVFFQKDNDMYIDLVSSFPVSSKNIRLDSLKLYDGVIRSKIDTRESLIHAYDIDRQQIMSLDKVYLGDIYLITGIMNKPIKFSNSYDTVLKGEIFKKNALLLEYDGFYEDINEFILIRKTNEPVFGDLYVFDNKNIKLFNNGLLLDNNIKLFKNVVPIVEKEMEKKKLLEKYREYRGI